MHWLTEFPVSQSTGMPSSLRTILFDFDYTLADSSTGVIACANYALAALGLPAVEPDEVRRTIGLSLADTFARLAGGSFPPDRFAAASKEFDRLFIRQADAIMADHTALFPFVADAAHALWRRGLTLGIVSSKFRYRIEHVLEREHLTAYFDVIIGREDVIAAKPNPEGLLTAMSALGSVPADTCYIGDSVTDAKTAQRAGTAFIAVLSGVTARADFAVHAYRTAIPSVAELPGAIAC